MSALIAGLVVFFAAHSVGLVAPAWRARQIARVGLRPWKVAYSAISLAGLVLIVRGFGMARAEGILVWQPPVWTRHVNVALTVIGFVLIAAAYVPGTAIKSALWHPMTAGVALWALGHLIANGGLADVILFGAFLVWASITFVTRRQRDRDAGVEYPRGSVRQDAIAIVAGIVVSLLFALYLHGPLIGVRPFG
jgi:uncharacterized membrane protein